MEQKQAIKIFEALASPIRLDIFRLLVQYNPDGLVAGDISSKLGIAPNNLSFHLKSLVYASLITAEQEGRFQRFRPDMVAMRCASDYILGECCLYTKKCDKDEVC